MSKVEILGKEQKPTYQVTGELFRECQLTFKEATALNRLMDAVFFRDFQRDKGQQHPAVREVMEQAIQYYGSCFIQRLYESDRRDDSKPTYSYHNLVDYYIGMVTSLTVKRYTDPDLLPFPDLPRCPGNEMPVNTNVIVGRKQFINECTVYMNELIAFYDKVMEDIHEVEDRLQLTTRYKPAVTDCIGFVKAPTKNYQEQLQKQIRPRFQFVKEQPEQLPEQQPEKQPHDLLKERADKFFEQLSSDLKGAPQRIVDYFNAKRSEYNRRFVTTYKFGFKTSATAQKFINDLKAFCRQFILELRSVIIEEANKVNKTGVSTTTATQPVTSTEVPRIRGKPFRF